VRLVRSIRGGGSGSTGAYGRGGRNAGEIEELHRGLVVGTLLLRGEIVATIAAEIRSTSRAPNEPTQRCRL